MFIEYRIHQTTKAPEGRHVPPGYRRRENWNVSKRSCIRRGWVPQPIGRGNLAPTIADVLVYLAPEGRQVPPGYGRHENWNVSNRSCIRRGWVSQPAGRGNLAPTIDTAPQILPHLAPEGRHVYSTRHTPNNQSPRGATGRTKIRETRKLEREQPKLDP